jgi:hypothetical protein
MTVLTPIICIWIWGARGPADKRRLGLACMPTGDPSRKRNENYGTAEKPVRSLHQPAR